MPIFLFNTHELTEHEDGRISGNWGGVYLLDLEKLTVEPYLMPEMTSWPQLYQRGWVADLMALSQDGDAVFLKVGLQKPDGPRMRYFLTQVTGSNKHIELLSPLESAFF